MSGAINFGSSFDYPNLVGRIVEPTTISVSSGKGGVGKTLSVINIATAMVKNGIKVLILDGDLGMSNVDIVLGLEPRYNIRDVLDGTKSIVDIIIDGPSGLKIIPSGSGIANLLNLSFVEKQMFEENIKVLLNDFDVILIDTGAGIGPSVLELNKIANRNLVITTPEPHSIADAYALIKVLSEELGLKDFSLLVNMAYCKKEGDNVAKKISSVAKQYLQVNVDYLGSVPKDPQVEKMVLRRQAARRENVKHISGQAWRDVTKNLIESCIQPKSYIDWNSIIKTSEETI